MPSSVEVDYFGFSFNYQILIIFKIGEKECSIESIIEIVTLRLKEIKIEF